MNCSCNKQNISESEKVIMGTTKKIVAKRKKSSDLEKMVSAISTGDNVRASKLLEKTIKSKTQAKIAAALKN